MKVIKPNSFDITTDATFARSSVGSYFNSTGNLVQANTNELRLNYNPDTLLFEGALIENAATNLLSYSEEMWNGAGWGGLFHTITSSTERADPYGGSNPIAKFVKIATGGDTVFDRKTLAIAAGTYSASIFVYVPTQAGTSSFTITVDFGDTESGTSSTITTFDKWVRITIPAVTVSFARAFVDFNMKINGGNSTPAGFTFYTTGSQLETGSKVTSYIKTTTSSATRAADVITGTGLVYTNAVNVDANYNSGTTYSIGQRVTYLNSIYESLQNSNLNKQPNLNPTWWIKVTTDNRHGAIDTMVSTVTTRNDELVIVLKIGKIDSLALVNVNAATCEFGLSSLSQGVLFSQKVGLSGVGVYNWYDYFFNNALAKRSQIIFFDLPLVGDSVIALRFKNSTGSACSVAQIAGGVSTYLGGTQYGMSAGITDFSKKESNQFGDTTLAIGNYRKELEAELFINKESVNTTQRFLYENRATPCVWIATEDPAYEEMSVVFGYYKDFRTTIPYPTKSLCSLQIEGLT